MKDSTPTHSSRLDALPGPDLSTAVIATIAAVLAFLLTFTG